MKGFIFSSDPSGRAKMTLGAIMYGGIALFGAYNVFRYSSQPWAGIILFGVGLNYFWFLVRTWGQFPDVFVDLAGVTIDRRGTEQIFRWHDVRECSTSDLVAYFAPEPAGAF